MSIGQNIKRLRRNAEMTQEELAEMLSISSQAVSRWETDSAMPDISLIPALVGIFGVSADELLEIDAAHLQEKVNSYKKQLDDLYFQHQYGQMLELARQAYRTMPNNMQVIGMLAFALTSGENAQNPENIDEAIRLNQLILDKSVDSTLRHRATANLCRLFAEKNNNKERALFYAKQLPKGHIQTAPYLIGRFDLLEDAEKEGFYRAEIDEHTRLLTDAMCWLADPNYENTASKLTALQRIELLKQTLDIQRIIYGKDLLSQNREFYEINRIIGCLWLLEGNDDEALKHFELAFEHAKAFEDYCDDDCYTSVALCGVECDMHYLWDETPLQDMMERFATQSRYDRLKDNPRFEKLLQALKKAMVKRHN